MQWIGDRAIFAATDLVGFLACEHLVGLELAAMAGLVERPVRLDPEIDLIARRGLEHEARYLAGLEEAGKSIVRIEQAPRDVTAAERLSALQASARATREVMAAGPDVIYQATFFDGRWLGLADFLIRLERPSDLGAWSYEVVDTKLARHVKASALLQICSYVEQLAAIQALEPEWMHVALGGSARKVERHRVADYMAYYRSVKAAFEARVALTTTAGAAYPPRGTYPEPVEHCEVCRWSLVCQARRRSDDDLALVAGAPGRVRQALKARGVATRRGLAALPLPLTPPLDGVGPQALASSRDQAAIQVRGQDAGKALYELLPPPRLPDGGFEPNRGLTSLPEPRPGDLFFDIEGDPFALDDGVDYLFGIVEPAARDVAGEPLFHAFWSIDETGQLTREAEKRAFERTIDFMIERLARDPAIHIYHYAPYEPTAMGRLMGRHATREAEVDRLLRGDVFVDLYRAVRQGLRASVESYSIKKLEPLYGQVRTENLRDAGSSIVAFETWLADVETGEAAPRSPETDATLQSIAAYNRDDCVSNLLLRDWLEDRRVELAEDLHEALPRPAPATQEPKEELSERLARVDALTERLCQNIPEAPEARTAQQQAVWLLAQLLSWHRREEKSFWWRYFYLMDDLTDEERVAEREPIGCLEPVGVVAERKRSTTYRYRFPEQDHEVQPGIDVRDPATGRSAGTVEAIDPAGRTIDLRRGHGIESSHPRSLVPFTLVDTSPLRESLMRMGEWVAAHGAEGGTEAAGEYEAGRRLLLRLPPRIRSTVAVVGRESGGLSLAGEAPLDAARRLAPRLDRTVLPVQGPPGSGKTYLGAEVAVDLVAAGQRVGVTANSHRVIGHLLDKIAERAAARGVAVAIGQKADAAGECTSAAAERFTDYPQLMESMAEREIQVVGGTAWLWARPEFASSVDVLIVDEAGQLSLANALAVAPAGRSLILLGDPQQLDQPLTGTHPPGAEASALGHVLDGASTMPAHLGLFLERTRRLHPDLCAFTSEAFYENRLVSEPWLARQRLDAAGPLSGTGVRFVEVEHRANTNSSIEEAAVVAELVADLAGEVGLESTEGRDGRSSAVQSSAAARSGLASSDAATWTDDQGETHRLDLADVLVVAPYNAQVSEIARLLPRARIGTVDKFQGQEAAVSIYSMATSSPEDAPRGMEFLYSLNRLNVATSRARCLAVVVASPDLIRVRARTPRQMRLANALCLFVERARLPD